MLVAWILIAAAFLAYRFFGFPGFFPIAVLFLSRVFLWPAFPEVDRIAWTVFWCAQTLLFVPSTAFIVAVLWGVITFGMFAFIFVSDAVLLYRGFRIAKGDAGAVPR